MAFQVELPAAKQQQSGELSKSFVAGVGVANLLFAPSCRPFSSERVGCDPQGNSFGVYLPAPPAAPAASEEEEEKEEKEDEGKGRNKRRPLRLYFAGRRYRTSNSELALTQEEEEEEEERQQQQEEEEGEEEEKEEEVQPGSAASAVSFPFSSSFHSEIGFDSIGGGGKRAVVIPLSSPFLFLSFCLHLCRLLFRSFSLFLPLSNAVLPVCSSNAATAAAGTDGRRRCVGLSARSRLH